jgi:hypothetical protein
MKVSATPKLFQLVVFAAIKRKQESNLFLKQKYLVSLKQIFAVSNQKSMKAVKVVKEIN